MAEKKTVSQRQTNVDVKIFIIKKKTLKKGIMHQQKQSKEGQSPPSAAFTTMVEQKPKRATRYTSFRSPLFNRKLKKKQMKKKKCLILEKMKASNVPRAVFENVYNPLLRLILYHCHDLARSVQLHETCAILPSPQPVVVACILQLMKTGHC